MTEYLVDLRTVGDPTGVDVFADQACQEVSLSATLGIIDQGFSPNPSRDSSPDTVDAARNPAALLSQADTKPVTPRPFRRLPEDTSSLFTAEGMTEVELQGVLSESDRRSLLGYCALHAGEKALAQVWRTTSQAKAEVAVRYQAARETALKEFYALNAKSVDANLDDYLASIVEAEKLRAIAVVALDNRVTWRRAMRAFDAASMAVREAAHEGQLQIRLDPEVARRLQMHDRMAQGYDAGYVRQVHAAEERRRSRLVNRMEESESTYIDAAYEAEITGIERSYAIIKQAMVLRRTSLIAQLGARKPSVIKPIYRQMAIKWPAAEQAPGAQAA